MNPRFLAAACGLAVVLFPRSGAGQEEARSTECSHAVDRRGLIACALAMSPSLREELELQRAADGRREAARTLLPANPVLSGALASRTSPTQRTLNWNLGLAQELEVTGQRGLRVDIAENDLRSQAMRVAAKRSAVAAEVWEAYFGAIAARERLDLAAKLDAATRAASSTVQAMATAGLASEVDSDVAEAAALHAAQDRLTAELLVTTTRAQLGLLLGTQAVPTVNGSLEPLGSVATALASGSERPELVALQQAQAASAQRVDLLRRSRLPNPSVSLFAQNDGFEEQVLGVGLSIPIPLPHPLGKTAAGEIAEAAALSTKAALEAERTGRELAAELLVAGAQYETSLKTRGLYTPARTQRAHAQLDAIGVQLKAARLSVREALVVQQALVELLKGEIDAREALCLASVRLTRAAGLSLEGESL